MLSALHLGRLANRHLGFRELTLWTAVVLLVNNLAAYLLYPHHDPTWTSTWYFQSGFGAFDAIAWGVVIWRLAQAADGAVSLTDTAFLLAICTIGSLPAREVAPIAATALALWLLRRTDAAGRAAGTVLAAIATHQIWGRAVFAALSPELVKLDTMLVGFFLSLGVPGTSWHDNLIMTPGGNGIAVFEGCASFANVSAALLAWVALTKLERVQWRRRDFAVAGAVVIAQLVLNVARMGMMALSLELYDYWHNGLGKEIYAVTASAAAVVISVIGSRWAEEPS